jgi:glucokinase
MDQIPGKNKIGKSIVGLDIGGSKTAVVEGTIDGHILQRHVRPAAPEEPFDEAFRHLTFLIEKVVGEASKHSREVGALSVSVGGPLQITEGVIINPPHLPGWHGVRLRHVLSERFPNFAVRIEHDGNAGALAEFRFGAGRGKKNLRHLVFLTCGTGMGAGIIVNGQILHGACDMAGEVGHIFLGAGGPRSYGKEGSWEGWSSGAGMLMLAIRMFPQKFDQRMSVSELVDMMLADDPEALRVAALAGTWLGRGIAILIDTLNPQMVVLGSLAVALGERILGPAKTAIAEAALPPAVEACEIVTCALGKQIGDVAALMAVIDDPTVLQLLS